MKQSHSFCTVVVDACLGTEDGRENVIIADQISTTDLSFTQGLYTSGAPIILALLAIKPRSRFPRQVFDCR